jgi:hypothetical protein
LWVSFERIIGLFYDREVGYWALAGRESWVGEGRGEEGGKGRWRQRHNQVS